MNQKERNILKLEESFRDTIENDILKQQTENKKIKIKDIKLVGSAEWNDKIKRRKWKRKNNRAKKLLFRNQMHSRNIRKQSNYI